MKRLSPLRYDLLGLISRGWHNSSNNFCRIFLYLRELDSFILFFHRPRYFHNYSFLCLQESHKHLDDADIEVEIQRELEEEEEAIKNAFKFNIEQELTKVIIN